MLLVRVRPDQAAALRRLADREAEPGRRADLSGLLRRIIDKALQLAPPAGDLEPSKSDAKPGASAVDREALHGRPDPKPKRRTKP